MIMSDFKLKNEPQKIDYDLYSKLTPESHIELIDGNLYWTTEERENLLKLLIFNVGIRRTLEIIDEHRDKTEKPFETGDAYKQYLKEKQGYKEYVKKIENLLGKKNGDID
jgi:hypothetical protein